LELDPLAALEEHPDLLPGQRFYVLHTELHPAAERTALHIFRTILEQFCRALCQAKKVNWRVSLRGAKMTYYGPKEMAASFRTVRANTIKIAEEIPEEKYSFRAAPGCRSVAETLVHIAVGSRLQEQIHITDHLDTLVGFDFFGFMGKQAAEEQVARSKAEILELLHTTGEAYAHALEGLSDFLLAETVQYPQGMVPPAKSRFEMLLSPKEHEMHHRGQLMLVQRLLGMVPPLTRQMEERVAAMRAASAQPV
jgi:uncharacterized damage-inducible protein DinB